MATEKRTEIHSTRNAPSIDGLSNVVVAVSWSRIVTNTVGEGEDAKTHVASYPGVTEIGAPDSNNFIDFDNVTDDHLKAWINEVVDISVIDERLEQHIQNSITAQINISRPSAQ